MVGSVSENLGFTGGFICGGTVERHKNTQGNPVTQRDEVVMILTEFLDVTCPMLYPPVN